MICDSGTALAAPVFSMRASEEEAVSAAVEVVISRNFWERRINDLSVIRSH
jgi:hypothetical protein